MKIYLLLTGLQVGWTHGARLGSDRFGSVFYSMCFLTQGPRLKKQPLFGTWLAYGRGHNQESEDSHAVLLKALLDSLV